MITKRLGSIESNYGGFQAINALYSQCKDAFLETIDLTLSDWFSANCASALGAVLYLIKAELNTVSVQAVKANAILHKNSFLSFLGEQKQFDSYNTTVSYKEISPKEHLYFNDYVMKELLSKECFPSMSHPLKKKIGEAIYEIFVNCEIHSETEKVFTSGQYFPNKNVLEFMISDIGIGLAESVNRKFSANFTSLEAIKWAIVDKNTTKTGIPGGIGLAILQEFIQKNGGKLTIVSGDGFWQMDNGKVYECILSNPFPGTSVNIYVRTDDTKNYALTSEKHEAVF